MLYSIIFVDMLQGIRHIIFDLGGVILNIDLSITQQAFKELGIGNISEGYSRFYQPSLFDDLETGKINKAQFLDSLKQSAGNSELKDEDIITAWNSLILDFPLRRLQILQQLQLYYDLVLLSNTNEIHEPYFNKVLQETHGIPNIGVFFDRVYYSHKLGMRKPSKEIFLHVLQDCGFKAEETLFIDDSPQNTAAASEVGIQTILLENGMTIEEHIFLAKQ